MIGNWTERVFAWMQRRGSQSVKPRRQGRRRFDANRRGAMIEHLEVLESRRLLTNIVAVHVSGGAVSLTDVSGHRTTTGDDFSVSYTGTQVVLTGANGTMFQVGGQTMSTFTATVTAPISIEMSLNKFGNAVSVTGDGTTDLSSLVVDLGTGRDSSTLSLTKVIADSMSISGGRHNDSVTLSQSTVNKNFDANLGRGTRAGESLDLESTTVTGNMSDKTSKLVMNQSTVGGTFSDIQLGRNSTFNSTDTTYTGAADIQMGQKGVINMLASTTGNNDFKSTETVTGRRLNPTTINVQTGALTNAVPPTLKHAVMNGTSTPAPTIASPTVTSLTNASAAPTITGTFDSTNTPNLSVAVNGQTYTFGTSPELTSPSAGTWSLDLANAPLTTGNQTYSLPVTATASNSSNVTKTGTGTVSNDQAAINAYLTANSLTATTTADGLNYVITTNGTGAIPKSGQTVTVNYTGHILNADGTLGTEFDSNVDAQFNHVTPFQFTLGAGQVIAGWDEAFALLPVGTVAKLLIPSELAYKDQSQTNIPANSILEFDVTLVSAS